MSKNMTPAGIRKLEVREKPYDTADGFVRGLYIRTEVSGSKIFRVRYAFGGKRRWLVLGEFRDLTLKQARDAARRVHGQVADGKDPAAERREARRQARQSGTVEEMCERFIEEYARPRKRTWREDERVLRKELIPKFGKLAPRDLQKGHLLEIVEAARKRGVDVGRNHLVALLKKLCRWATTVDILEASPAATLERPAKPVPRDRVLSPDELGAYWRGLGTVEGIDPRTRWALQLQCLLALRIGEVTNARKVEVQLQDATYRIPADRMKAKEKHTVPLPEAAAEIFGRAMAASPPRSPWVFASDSGDGPIRADSAIRALNKLQAKFGFTEPFRSHDVRRTAATMLAAKGVQPLVLDRVLAHKPSSVTDKHYNWHDYAAEKRDALELWSGIINDAARAASKKRGQA